MDNVQVGTLIVLLREKKGILQSEFAEQLGVAPSTLCKWESGSRSISVDFIESICNILDIRCDDLLHPDITLGNIENGTFSFKSQNKKHESKAKKIEQKWIIAAGIISVLLLFNMCLLFQILVSINKIKAPDFEVISTKYDMDENWGRSFDIAVFTTKNLDSGMTNSYMDEVTADWEKGKYDSEVKVIRIFFYEDEKIACEWGNTETLGVILNPHGR